MPSYAWPALVFLTISLSSFFPNLLQFVVFFVVPCMLDIPGGNALLSLYRFCIESSMGFVLFWNDADICWGHNVRSTVGLLLHMCICCWGCCRALGQFASHVCDVRLTLSYCLMSATFAIAVGIGRLIKPQRHHGETKEGQCVFDLIVFQDNRLLSLCLISDCLILDLNGRFVRRKIELLSPNSKNMA